MILNKFRTKCKKVKIILASYFYYHDICRVIIIQPSQNLTVMTIAQEIYEKNIWGSTKEPITVLAQVRATSFQKGTLVVRCVYLEKEKCLYFEDFDPARNKVIFTYRLYQDGRKTN